MNLAFFWNFCRTALAFDAKSMVDNVSVKHFDDGEKHTIKVAIEFYPKLSFRI